MASTAARRDSDEDSDENNAEKEDLIRPFGESVSVSRARILFGWMDGWMDSSLTR